jgi:hypothetical protein
MQRWRRSALVVVVEFPFVFVSPLSYFSLLVVFSWVTDDAGEELGPKVPRQMWGIA